jgi:hypothetical protein
MSKKLSILVLLFVGLLTSCIGDIGPQGPPGFDGFDGQDGLDGADGLIGSIFEVEATFTEADAYEFFADIPTSIDIFDTDVVIAYTLSGVDDGVDIWEPLPQTLFFGNDILLYGYDYTVADVRFFLDGTIDLTTLDALYTDNILFRVAVIPADFAATINTANFNEVMSAMKIDNVERVQ